MKIAMQKDEGRIEKLAHISRTVWSKTFMKSMAVDPRNETLWIWS